MVPCAPTAAQRVFGGGHAGFVEEHIGAGQARGTEFQPVRRSDGGAQLLEGEEMGVEAPPADYIAARRRQRHLAAAREQRSGQQDRGADPRAKFRVEISGADFLGMNRKSIALAPFRRSTNRADQFDQGLGVADPRHVPKRYRMLGQQRGGDDRQCRILVARRLDHAGKPVAAFNYVLDGYQSEVLNPSVVLLLSRKTR